MKIKLTIAALFATVVASAQISTMKDKVAKENFEFANQQLRHAFVEIDAAHKAKNTTPEKFPTPRNVEPDGSLRMMYPSDWCSGFFAGVLWYMYEETQDNFWKQEAQKYTDYLKSEQYNTNTHDLGFMMYCSFGNGLRLAKIPGYKDILIQSSRSLITRYNPKTGLIRSWDPFNGWKYPVIIDNMMNLEMLFWATKATGDSTFYNIAVSHADKTLANHFRDDYSSYHVVDYDVDGDGQPRMKQTHQGYADDSAWARGQAWGLYGFTMCYRETGDKKYLDLAENIAKFILTNKNLPKDLIPYWDYDAPNIPNEPRDVSAAAVTASALYELSTMSKNKGSYYKKMADKITDNISKYYRAPLKGARGFITTCSTGHWPNKSEINTSINYADYYYIEALVRRERLAEHKPVVPPVKF